MMMMDHLANLTLKLIPFAYAVYHQQLVTLCYAQLNTKCYIPHNIYKGMLIIL